MARPSTLTAAGIDLICRAYKRAISKTTSSVFSAGAFPKIQIKVFFDVGANIGWVAKGAAEQLPEAEVYAFEPAPTTVQLLKENLGRFPGMDRIKIEAIALGDRNGRVQMTNHPGFTTNRVMASDDQTDTNVVEIEIQRGDDFCKARGIQVVDYLKVDAEGLDLEVLHGFSAMLGAGAINILQVEVGFSGENALHRPLSVFEDYLRPLGYRLMLIKNQSTFEAPYLQYADCIFIREAYAHEGGVAGTPERRLAATA